jgi:hypothetical protein
MVPGYVMYKGFGLNLALSHIIAAEDDNRVYQTLQLVQTIILSVILTCDGHTHVKEPPRI